MEHMKVSSLDKKQEKERWCELTVEVAETFDLENAVCSHGLFMMAPNHWDHLTKTLQRPLHLSTSHNDDTNSLPASLLVRISQPQIQVSAHFLSLRVFGTQSLSPHHRQVLLAQVTRMLRLSESEERNAREYQSLQLGLGEDEKRCFGRVFRSPTLWEDMVKCMLLCNCQWPRTLSMARSLCELQLELSDSCLKSPIAQNEHLIPMTPARKEPKRKLGVGGIVESNVKSTKSERDILEVSSSIGNFPMPEEIANLNERFLAKRCGLGYRASRILKLAQSVVDGRIELRGFEEVVVGSSSNYKEVAHQLKQIDGFGPFTCANVLMCMGFYHVIPADTETIRHFKQVHGRKTSIQTVERDVEEVYGKYAPFQFLAYWSEVWGFYEKRFGKLSEMPPSQYKLITATNMRVKQHGTRTHKRTKLHAYL